MGYPVFYLVVLYLTIYSLHVILCEEDLTEDEDENFVYYTNYSTVLIPSVLASDKLQALQVLRKNYEKIPEGSRSKQVTFFDDILVLERPIFFVVSPDVQTEVLDQLTEASIEYKVIKTDLQLVFDYNWDRNEFQKKRYKDTIAQDIYMAPFYYMPYKEMTEFLKFMKDDMNTRLGEIASTFTIGKSSKGDDIFGFALNEKRRDLSAIWIDGGLDGRNYLAQAMSIFLIWEIVQKNEDRSMYLRENFRWYFIPNTNPDGYTFNIDIDRMWRKNTNGVEEGQDKGCFGVNLEKNFPVNFGGLGTSKDPCSDLYPGQEPLSEPESQALASALRDRKDDITLYINLAGFGNSWNIPWYGDSDVKPEDYDYQGYLAKIGVEAIADITKTPPSFGTHPDLQSAKGGSVLDFVKKELGVPYAYSVDLRPVIDEIPMEANYFDLPPTFIHLCGPEMFAAISRMAQEILKGVQLPPEEAQKEEL